ncbi:MAG: PAS-domain containing protein [Alphaproteobacteria bacterium]|nr:PAS-domain containing protein [Alphaproteobacteria bacterium]
MEAYKNLITNISLFVLIGAVPSLCWAAGYFSPFSFASFFLLLAGFFGISYFKTRAQARLFKKLLLNRGEAWAICEGTRITESSPSFPTTSFSSLKDFFDPAMEESIEKTLNDLIFHNTSFHLRVSSAKSEAIYTFEGTPLEDRFVLWLKNITDKVHQEKTTKEYLKRREEQVHNMQSILDSIPILIWQRDEYQKITYCNYAYAHALQTTPEKIYEQSLELTQPRFAKVLARKAVHTGELQSFESSAIMEGEKRYFRIYETQHPLKASCTVGLACDITDLNNIRLELKRLVNAHDEVLAHLSTAISVHDAEGILQYYNQAYVTLYDFDEEFLKTNPRLDEVLEELRGRRQLPEFADFLSYKKKRMMQLKEQIDPFEELMHLPDERTLRTFSAPHPMGGLLFMSEDVTDYLSLERKNKSFLNAYQATLDNLFEGVIVFGSDNRLKIFNPSFLRLWNFSPKDVAVDQHITTIIDKLKNFFDYDEDWDTFKAKFLEKMTDRVPKTEQLTRKDGMIINYSYLPLPNGDHLLSYTDTTDTLRVQNIHKEKRNALESAEKIKSEFIANISYELRAPLNTIISFTEILSNEYFGSLNKRQLDYVEGIVSSSEKLLHLVNDILDLASLEAGYINMEYNPVNIPNLLKEMVSFFSKTIDMNKQYLVIKCDNFLKDWPVDGKRLKQVVLNLISNAIKFTPEGGIITVDARVTEDKLEISILDTGAGGLVEEQEKLFQVDMAPDSSDLGIGLSLSLVKKLVQLHGGEIKVESKPKKGTKVTCLFPKPIKIESLSNQLEAS